MGIRGLWKYIDTYSEDPKKHFGEFNRVYIDATLLVIWLASPIGHLPREQFDLVFKRNLVGKITSLRQFLKGEDTTGHIIFVLDPGKMPSNKIRPRSPVNIHPDSFAIFRKVIQETSDTAIIAAPDEADLEISRRVSARDLVFTDDSDLVQWSPWILRFNEREIYSRTMIIKKLGITLSQFKKVCSVAANDYNDSSHTFSRALKIVLGEDSPKDPKKRSKKKSPRKSKKKSVRR